MGQEITGNQIEDVLFNILQKCKMETDNNQLIKPIEDFLERSSYYTGIPKEKLQEILNSKQPENILAFKPMNFETQVLIYKCIIKFYTEKQLPSYKLLFDQFQNEGAFNNFKQFKLQLNLLGFEYRTILNNTVLLEDANYSFEKYFYLNKMKKMRANKASIYYIDERLIDKKLTLEKPWKESINTACNNHEYILFYAISKSGYKNGLFCNQADPEQFYKWVVDILLGLLEPSSVIVFDNSPLHGKPTMKAISKYATKQDMLKWLQKHDVPHSHKMSRAELYQLIQNLVIHKEMNSLDQVIKASGHEVIRLPTNMINLSPVDLMWAELRESLSTPLLDPVLFETKDEIHAQLVSMPKEKFVKFEMETVQKENQLLALHQDLDKVQDRFLEYLKLNIKIEVEHCDDIEMSESTTKV